MLGLKDFLHVLQHFGSQGAKFGASVINGGQAHSAQDSIWNGGGPRNLQKVAAYGMKV
jgi:hypothetical protein